MKHYTSRYSETDLEISEHLVHRMGQGLWWSRQSEGQLQGHEGQLEMNQACLWLIVREEQTNSTESRTTPEMVEIVDPAIFKSWSKLSQSLSN